MTHEQEIESAAKLASIEYMVVDIHTRLFGNGQPGELDKIKARLDREEEVTNRFKGAVAVIVGLMTLLGGTEILHITGKL